MRLEVRCCCQPKTLLGWMEVPEGIERGKISFPCMPAKGLWKRITQRRSVKLKIARIRIGSMIYPALQADVGSLELLRRVPSFIENVGGAEGHLPDYVRLELRKNEQSDSNTYIGWGTIIYFLILLLIIYQFLQVEH